MTQPPQAQFGAEPSGFIPPDTHPPGNLPAKTGIRHRAMPACEIRVDAWLLQPATLRAISADLRQQARSSANARRLADRDHHLDDAADTLDDFISRRRIYGEKPRAW